MSSSAFDHAVQAKVALIYQDPNCVAADNVNQNTISLVEPEGNGVVVTGTAQPALAVIVPGVQGPSGTAFEEIPLNKLAPGALPSGVTVASANIVDGTIVNADINAAAGIVDTKLATISTAGKVSNSATTATADNTANAIVARDASGNFTANLITADLAGKSDSTDELENGLTFSSSGNGIASGTEFDGTVAATVSYNSVGAAAAGHSHANLIFVPVGANDTALAAVFTDAAANDKKIVFSEDTTVKIPTVAATIQAVCELVVPTVSVEILIESGHEIASRSTIDGGDFSRWTITSVDAEVAVGTDIRADRLGVLTCYDCSAPEWDILLDCDSLATYGVAMYGSKMTCTPGKGVRGATEAGFFVVNSSALRGQNDSGVGIVAAGNGRAGIWCSSGASMSSRFNDLTNNGEFGVFASRASMLQVDNSDFTGCAQGIRCGSSIVRAAESTFEDIPGWSALVFSSGFVHLGGSRFTNCGSDTEAILQIGVGNTGRNQSVGEISAENCNFNNALGVIARVNGGNGYIDINNAIGADVNRRVALVSGGQVTCRNSNFTAKLSNPEAELLLPTRGGRVDAFATVFNGNGVVRNVASSDADSSVFLEGCLSTNFTENAIARVNEGGYCYAQGASHNGSTNPMNRGFGANGEFVKYPNGSQECWAWLQATTIETNKKMSVLWTFPSAFILPLSSISVTGTLAKRDSSNTPNSGTQNKLKDAQLIIAAHSQVVCTFEVEINSTATTEFTTGNTVWIRAHAIGRWF